MRAKLQLWLRDNWILLLIVILGLSLRLWGIGYGLPYLYHPDESVSVTIALRMLQTGNLNPNFFDWPSLLFYANALLYGGYFVVGRLFGWFSQPTDLAVPDIITMAVGKVQLPAEIWLSRGLDMLVGTLSIILVYRICRALTPHKFAGWLAALWFAVETNSARESQYIRPDTLLVLFTLISVYYALKIVDDPRARNYVFAGIAAGLATASKYNAAPVVIPIALAHLMRFGWRGIFRKEIYFAALASLAAFFVTMPYALLDWKRFWETGILGDATHYATEHEGSVGSSFVWYLDLLWGIPGAVLALAIGESIYPWIAKSKKEIVAIAFPFVYFIFISLFSVHFVMMLLPVIPFVFIFAALFVARVLEFLTTHNAGLRKAASIGVSGFALIVALPLLAGTLSYDGQIYQLDAREMARVWIENNLPTGARIAVEPYSPYVSRDKFMVEGTAGMAGHPPAWYVDNGFEYLVFSYGTFGRFYENPDQYPDFIQKYETLFAQFSEIKNFDAKGSKIRIFKTNVSGLPSIRSAARFGIYSDWLEFVGYKPTQVEEGKPAEATLYWRVLEQRREALTLTVRLLDRNDHEVAQSSGALFGAKSPTGGIVQVPWSIAALAEPGMYRLELDVDAQGQGRIPVLSRTYEKISDKLFVGPFKISPASISAAELANARAVNARFGDAITLLGYSVSNRAVRACQNLETRLYWKSGTHADKDYTVFMHLLDSTGKVVAQIDAPPRGGAYPTALWDTSEIVRDDYSLTLGCDLPPGDYRIELGMYEYPSLTRLGVTNAKGDDLGDHLILDDTIRVTQ